MTHQEYSPGLQNVIAAVTRISYLDVEQEEIVVRGYNLIELAEHCTYLEVAYLLIYGTFPTREQVQDFESRLRSEAEIPESLYHTFLGFPKQMHVMDGLRTGISLLAGYEDPELLADPSREANITKGLRILARAPAIAANVYHAMNGEPFVHPHPDLNFTANFLYMIQGRAPDDQAVTIFDRMLVCYSEHELPNSTFAARVIASTLTDIYGAIVGAIASLKGPLHGGANEASLRMLLDILDRGGSEVAETYVLEKLARKERIMGFGHRVYMRKHDPRAVLLEQYIPQLIHRKPEGPELYAIYRKVAEVMAREKGIYPNTDYPIGLILYLLDVPIDLYTPIFLCARTAGLVAHVIEQHAHNRLYRPRVRYEGPRGLHPPAMDTT